MYSYFFDVRKHDFDKNKVCLFESLTKSFVVSDIKLDLVDVDFKQFSSFFII